MLDEIDKIGSSFQGDPASALLEVLDPEQNSQFLDHYLDLHVDLSKVLFVCTANQLDTIPGPLLDRMEDHSSGGIPHRGEDRHRQEPSVAQGAGAHGLKEGQLRVINAALRLMIEDYAREAGVRNLEKQLRRIIAARRWSVYWTSRI